MMYSVAFVRFCTHVQTGITRTEYLQVVQLEPDDREQELGGDDSDESRMFHYSPSAHPTCLAVELFGVPGADA